TTSCIGRQNRSVVAAPGAARRAVMTKRLDGSVAVVTGAARGVGRSIAERLASEGARVACLDVSSERIQTAVADMRASSLDVHAYEVDIGNRDDVHATIRRIEGDLGAPV